MKTCKTHQSAILAILAALGYSESGSIQAQIAAAEIRVTESERRCATIYSHRATEIYAVVNW